MYTSFVNSSDLTKSLDNQMKLFVDQVTNFMDIVIF